MDKRLSLKFSTISFLLLMMVVVGHAVNIKYTPDGIGYGVWFFENVVSDKFTKVVIPIFFFISAYLFFLNVNPDTISVNTFKEKIGKRMKTLLIPYLFWCTIWFAFVYIIQLHPAIGIYFGEPIHTLPKWKQFWLLYLEPVNYQFWFIRELLLYVLITPLLFLAVKHLKWFFLVFLYAMAAYSLSVFTVWNIDIYRYHMIFYYSLGIYCAINKVSLSLAFIPTFIQVLLVSLFVFLCCVLLWLDVNVVPDYGIWYNRLYLNLISMIGCVGLWAIYDTLDQKFDFKYYQIYSFAFIIYACHGVPILLLKEALVAVLAPSPLARLLLYFATILFTIIMCVGFGKLFKKYLPKGYQLVTGNR